MIPDIYSGLHAHALMNTSTHMRKERERERRESHSDSFSEGLTSRMPTKKFSLLALSSLPHKPLLREARMPLLNLPSGATFLPK